MRADEGVTEVEEVEEEEEPEETGMETDKGIDMEMAEEMAGRPPGVVGEES
jgi:hypothetical protein